MKEKQTYLSKIEKILVRNSQYKLEGYHFLLAALHHTVSELKKPRHVSGQELLGGIRDYALEQYGPLTKTVLNYWGIHETVDFGHIVFALVEAGILRKQPEDTIKDFEKVFDFTEAFDKGYKISD